MPPSPPKWSNDLDKTVTVVLKGGKGSGFYGHRGRPGQEGGSLPRGENATYIDGILEYQGYHQDNLRKVVRRSYFSEEKERLVNSRLRTSLQDQYVVLGFDPLEMIRRNRTRVYLLDEKEFEWEAKHWHGKDVKPTVVGFVSSKGSVYLDCGRWTTHYPKGSYGYEHNMEDLDTVDVDTITHEFGHILWSSIADRAYWIDEDNPKYPHAANQAIGEWTVGWGAKEFGRHTEYSNKNEREGFAEPYMAYCAAHGVSTDPAVSKTFDQIRKFIEIARRKYAK